MKTLSAILTFLMCAVLGRADSLAFVYYDKDCPQQFAVINGALESMKDLSLRFQKKLDIENYTPQTTKITPDIQAAALKDAKKAGSKGAILFAAKGDRKNLIKTISDLSKENFPIVLIGRDIDSNDMLCSVLRDDKKFTENFRKNYPPKTQKENFTLFFIVQGNKEAKISKETAIELMPPNISEENLSNISEGFKVEYYSCTAFSALQKKFGEDWYLRDNYGVIILDERILADVAAFATDSDRLFVFSPQTAPILFEYLKSGAIPLCIADDYFGYGYIAAVKLLEKIFDGTAPYKRTEYLAPLKYTPDNYKQFNQDWINFLK